ESLTSCSPRSCNAYISRFIWDLLFSSIFSSTTSSRRAPEPHIRILYCSIGRRSREDGVQFSKHYAGIPFQEYLGRLWHLLSNQEGIPFEWRRRAPADGLLAGTVRG